MFVISHLLFGTFMYTCYLYLMENNKYTIEGSVVKVLEPKAITDSFTLHQFVVKTEESYPQELIFQASGEAFQNYVASSVSQGDKVKVHFNVSGRASNDKYYVSLKAWKIEK